MSKETLNLLLRMNHDRLETQIALQCAPASDRDEDIQSSHCQKQQDSGGHGAV